MPEELGTDYYAVSSLGNPYCTARAWRPTPAPHGLHDRGIIWNSTRVALRVRFQPSLRVRFQPSRDAASLPAARRLSVVPST